MENVRDVDEFIERKICIGMIASDEYIKKISPILKLEFIESSAAKDIIRWCFGFFEQHNKAPGKDIEMIYMNKLKEGLENNPDRAARIERILESLNKEYVTSEGIDPFLLQSTVKYFRYRQAKILHEIQEDALEKGDLQEFHQAVMNFKPLVLDTSNELIKAGELYAMDIKEVKWLVRDLIPKGLTICAGRSKVGKSYFLMQMAVNLVQRKKIFREYGYTVNGSLQAYKKYPISIQRNMVIKYCS